jgi:pyruvate-formate lyase-activating enzyme
MTRHLDLKLSYACNNNCVHCVVSDQRDSALAQGRRDFRTTAEVARELSDAAARGFTLVTFTGGEPTMRRDLPALVRCAVGLGLGVGLQTNGRVLSQAAAREPLLGLGVRFVVALHGPDAATHDAVVRVDGAFDQTRAAMCALAAAGEKVTAKVVLSRLNAASLRQIAEVVVETGVRRANLTFPHGLGNARRHFAEVMPRYADVMPHLAAAIGVLEAAEGAAVTEAVPPCLLGPLARCASEACYRAHVHSEVRQLDQGPRDWSRDRSIEGKAKPPTCAACVLDAECEGVWREYLEAFGGDELVPVKGHPPRGQGAS